MFVTQVNELTPDERQYVLRTIHQGVMVYQADGTSKFLAGRERMKAEMCNLMQLDPRQV